MHVYMNVCMSFVAREGSICLDVVGGLRTVVDEAFDMDEYFQLRSKFCRCIKSYTFNVSKLN